MSGRAAAVRPAAAAPVGEIEERRRQAGFSQEMLARAAGISSGYYRNALTGARQASPALVARLKSGLYRLERSAGEPQRHGTHVTWRLAVVLAARLYGEDPAAVLAHDPARRATADPQWLAAARVRERALYICHVICGLAQRELAAVAGMTPAAVSYAMGRVEDARDEDADDPLFGLLEMLIGGDE